MQNLMKYIMSGFPEDAHAKPYNTYKSALYIVDMLIMFGERVVVPLALRQSVLHLLHAAHQGVDCMKARSADVVFWHGIVGDLARHREACQACHKIAKSNQSLPPYDPPEPEYPFQYLAADYFHYGNKDYCVVVVDRYSHWPTVFMAEQGARGFTKHLRRMFSTFGICQELATDGASVFTGGLTQAFLQNWDVQHRLSSVANPHRAELAVKQLKRMITENSGPSGTLDVDSFHRAILSYRNTPACVFWPLQPPQHLTRTTRSQGACDGQEANRRQGAVGGPHHGPCQAGAGGQLLPAELGGQPPQAVGAHRQGCGVQGVRTVPVEGQRHWQDHSKEQETPQEVPTNPQTLKTAHHAAWAAHRHCHSCHSVANTSAAYPSPKGHVKPAQDACLPAPACCDPSLRSDQHLQDTLSQSQTPSRTPLSRSQPCSRCKAILHQPHHPGRFTLQYQTHQPPYLPPAYVLPSRGTVADPWS